MKKLILICFVLVSAKGFSQSFVSNIISRLEYGVKAGGNYSNFSNANFPTEGLAGFHAGVTLAYKITDNFLINEDILFSSQGARTKGGALGDQDIRLSYLTVPFLLKYRTKAGFYVEGGMQTGLKLSENVAGYSGSGFAKTLDYAAAGGIGFQSKIGLGVGARYVYGLNKVGNFTSADINNDFKTANIQVSIFYVF